MNKNILYELKQLITIANSIVNNFGENTEVVLHDLRTPEESVVYIAGNVTNRKLGAPVTNFVLEAMKSGEASLDCYKTITKDGKILRSTTTLIRNKSDEIVGCMCINFDITEYLHSKTALDKLTFFPKFHAEKNQGEDKPYSNEFFENDIMSIINNMVAETIQSFGKPIEVLNKDEKMKFVQHLENRGVFLVKGSVEQIAELLGVSKFTIYNYLVKSIDPGKTK